MARPDLQITGLVVFMQPTNPSGQEATLVVVNRMPQEGEVLDNLPEPISRLSGEHQVVEITKSPLGGVPIIHLDPYYDKHAEDPEHA